MIGEERVLAEIHNRYLSLRVRRLINFMVERFGARPYWDQTIL